MENKYIGVLPKGINPNTKGTTNGNYNEIYELKEDGLYYGNNLSLTKEQIEHDLKLGYLKILK